MGEVPRAGGPVVAFIAANQGMAARLLQRHHDDGSGHCHGCVWHGSSRPASVHPCLIHLYARQAVELEHRTASGWNGRL